VESRPVRPRPHTRPSASGAAVKAWTSADPGSSGAARGAPTARTLRVTLITPDRHPRHAVRQARLADPGPQQDRLPAPRRGRHHGHLCRRPEPPEQAGTGHDSSRTRASDPGATASDLSAGPMARSSHDANGQTRRRGRSRRSRPDQASDPSVAHTRAGAARLPGQAVDRRNHTDRRTPAHPPRPEAGSQATEGSTRCGSDSPEPGSCPRVRTAVRPLHRPAGIRSPGWCGAAAHHGSPRASSCDASHVDPAR
jgi:hypothetical protein